MSVKFVEKGKIVVTPRIAERMESDNDFATFVETSFARYRHGDWGDTCEEDARHNDYALTHKERILAVYIYDEEDIKNYLTEYTTFLFPLRDGKMGMPPKSEEPFAFKKTPEKNPDGEKIWIITEWDSSVTTILFPSEY
ncbi:MAG: hypothetical protein LIO96_07940 [Lachnospiraceae bacterium]|nr:hypothetical protein [Lachnospiraceae bacterium]